MKLQINPYIIGLLKENISYIGLNVVIGVLILFFLSLNTNKALENSNKINTLTRDVQNLQKRALLFNNVFTSETDLDSNVKLLNELVPNMEDYFSVIYALEKLSQKTSFIITSYTIDLKSSTPEKLKLSITGTGDRNAFLKFLSEYNFGGGRLITSDKIELTPQISGQIKVDVTFYNKKITSSNNPLTYQISPQLLQELSKLKEKVSFDLKSSTEEGQVNPNYPRKANPF